MGDTDWAIVAGLTHYPGLTALDGPERDAREFYQWVTKPESEGGGGVTVPGQAKLIVSSDYAPEAEVRKARPQAGIIVEELEGLQQRAEQSLKKRAGRRLYLFFAGHGCSPTTNEAMLRMETETALLMANAREGAMGHHVPGTGSANWARHGTFEEVILFMDCCRDLIQNVLPTPLPFSFQINPQEFNRNPFVYGFATRWASRSRERKFGVETKGVFSTVLMRGLNGAAAETEGRITPTSLRDYVHRTMKKLVGESEMQEGPEFRFPNTKEGEGFVIARAKELTHLELRVTFPESWSGARAVLFHGDKFLLIAETVIESGVEWRLPVPDGIYIIQVPDRAAAVDVTVAGLDPVVVQAHEFTT